MASTASPGLKRVGGGYVPQPNITGSNTTVNAAASTTPVVGMPSQQDLVSAITVALQSALPSILGKNGVGPGGANTTGDMSQDLIGLGLGLGLGLGMRQQMAGAQVAAPSTNVAPSGTQQTEKHDRQEAQEELAREEAAKKKAKEKGQEDANKEAAALSLMLTPTPDAIESDTHAAAGKDKTHHQLAEKDKILPLVKVLALAAPLKNCLPACLPAPCTNCHIYVHVSYRSVTDMHLLSL